MILYNVKWIYRKWGIRACTFGSFQIFSDDGSNKIRVNHENIHKAQYKEVGFFKALWIYWTEYRKLYEKYKDKVTANMLIRFEQEAYSNAKNLDYLKTREAFAWRKY